MSSPGGVSKKIGLAKAKKRRLHPRVRRKKTGDEKRPTLQRSGGRI
jgi:hypothetical protein